jgi:hypothetical protein
VLGGIALRGLKLPMPKLAAATDTSRVTGGRWSRPGGCRARERHQLDPT